MKALIVYDSFFGNTEKVANEIGQAIGSQSQVTVVRASDTKAEILKGVEYLIVGSPTRAFKASDAINQFLKDIPNDALKGINVTAFDTRISIKDVNNVLFTVLGNIFGYAAEPIAKQLQKKGGILVIPAEGFFVKGTEGPLKDGELERAASWAKKIIQQ